MWNSGLGNAIPVPLGYIDWQWRAQAALKNGTWKVTSPPIGVKTSSFMVSNKYPQWQAVTLNAIPAQCALIGQ